MDKTPKRESKATRQATPDMRNHLAKARDEFLESDEGKMLCQTNILRDRTQRFFLENRLVAAFIAGYNKAKE